MALVGIATTHAASDDALTRLREAQALVEAGDHARAERRFSAVLSTLAPDDREARAWGHFGRAFARQQLHEAVEADPQTLRSIVEEYRLASMLDPSRYLVAANFNSGLILRRLGEHRLALNAFLQAATGNHAERPRFVLNAGREYEALGMAEQAADAYIRSIESAPGADEPRRALLALYLRHRWDERLLVASRSWSTEQRLLSNINYALMELLQRKNPAAERHHAEAGLILLATNHARVALSPSDFGRSTSLEYAKVAAVHPGLQAPLRALVAAYAAPPMAGHYFDGPDSHWWKEDDERRRTWSTVLLSLGNTYWLQVKHELAASYYEAAIGYSTPYRLQSWVDLEALAMLAATYSELQRMSRVQQLVSAVDRWVAEKAPVVDSQRRAIRDFYFYAGVAYTETVDYAPAEALYLKSLGFDPRFAEAHINLGFIYQGNLDLAGAIDHFERGLALDPTNPTANNNLGFTTLIHGDFVKAIKYLRRSHELNRALLVTINLGDAYRYAGDVDRALQFHREARDGIRERGDDVRYMSTRWRYNYMPLQAGDTRTIQHNILVSTKDEKRAFVHYALSLDETLAGNFEAAQSNFDLAKSLAADSAFRCFFANKIAAIGGFLRVPPRSKQWLDERRLELRRGLVCEGS